MILDQTFQRRQPSFIKRIREIFGFDAIRITRNHAKFLLLKTEKFKIVVRTSMNLNFNPRFEDIDVKDDSEMYDFIDGILTALFNQTDPRAQVKQSVRKLTASFKKFNG